MDPSQYDGYEEYVGDDVGDVGDEYYEGEDEVGRRPRRRRVRRRRYRGRGRGRQPAPPPRRRRRQPAPQGRDVVLVKDHIEIIVATDSDPGAVSEKKLISDTMHLSHATFDGSSNGAAITSLMLHKATVLGPFDSTEALPASAFTASSQQKLSLNGNVIRSGQYVTLNGSIENGDDVLKLLLYGKREVEHGEC